MCDTMQEAGQHANAPGKESRLMTTDPRVDSTTPTTPDVAALRALLNNGCLAGACRYADRTKPRGQRHCGPCDCTGTIRDALPALLDRLAAAEAARDAYRAALEGVVEYFVPEEYDTPIYYGLSAIMAGDAAKALLASEGEVQHG